VKPTGVRGVKGGVFRFRSSLYRRQAFESQRFPFLLIERKRPVRGPHRPPVRDDDEKRAGFVPWRYGIFRARIKWKQPLPLIRG
jgi:hypothetical protein